MLASFAGGAYALTILLNIPALPAFLLKALACVLLMLIGFGKMNLKSFLVHVLLFLSMNVLIGGLVILLSLADKETYYSNLSVHYMNVSPLHLLIALVISYFGVNIVSRLLRKKQMHAAVYKVFLKHMDAEYTLFGFCDTGNNLSEPFSSLPVCIIKQGILKDYDKDDKKRIIPFTSLGGEGVVYAVKAEISLESKKGKYIHAQVYLAQSTPAFKDTEYDIILNPKIFTPSESL